MSENGPQTDFEYWLAEMDDALDRFLKSTPAKVADLLDFKLGSLSALEQVVVSGFPNADVLLKPEASEFLDGAARYLGETVRRCAGGRWFIELTNPRDAFFGIPQVRGFGNGRTALCPASLVTACADRRTGRYLETVVANILRRSAGWGQKPVGVR